MTLSLFLNTATVMAKNIPEVGTTWGLRWVQWVCRLEWEVWLDKVWKMRSGWLGVSSSIRAQRTLVTGNQISTRDSSKGCRGTQSLIGRAPEIIQQTLLSLRIAHCSRGLVMMRVHDLTPVGYWSYYPCYHQSDAGYITSDTIPERLHLQFGEPLCQRLKSSDKALSCSQPQVVV